MLNAVDKWRGRLCTCMCVSKQTVDTLSNCCDNNNIHSAIYIKLSLFDKYDKNFILLL